MSPENALTIMSICAVIGTGLNVYLSLKIGNSVLKLKDWARETFVDKEQFYRYADAEARPDHRR